MPHQATVKNPLKFVDPYLDAIANNFRNLISSSLFHSRSQGRGAVDAGAPQGKK